jgi:signal transduction histidine kinase
LTAAAPREVISRPIRGALAPLLAALAVLAALLAAATLVQLRMGLRPLRALRDQVAAIRNGTRQQVEEEQPSELMPLAVELNALARDNRAALAAARLAAANLAHALKTPVATLALDVRHEPARAAQVARIDVTIRHHLARARADAGNHRAATPLAAALAGLVTALHRLHADKRLDFAVDVPAALHLAMDPQDADELLGNLLDNAAKHAARRIAVSASAAALDLRRIVIEIGDDGPGIPPGERSLVLQPGVRLDQRTDGDGFGLAIAADLVSLYGGTIELGEAALGGLLVRLTMPAGAN